MVRVLIVEDSRTAADLLASILESDPEVRVVGRATSGLDGVAAVERLRPDVVTMDIGLPGIDGHEATRRIMRQYPTPIVLVSGTVDPRDVRASMDALSHGALAVLAKPVGPRSGTFTRDACALVSTVKAMAGVKVIRRHGPRGTPARVPSPVLPHPRLVTVAASTGGPGALKRVLGSLPARFPAPILLVQHITAGFVDGFAAWLDSQVALRVKVAEADEPLRDGVVYVAPEGRHLGCAGRHVKLAGAAPIGGFRPSATWLFRAAAEQYGRDALGVVLTGMGDDGVAGLRDLRAAGGRVIAQDEASSVVWGMPGAAVAAGLADAVVPLADIAARVCALVGDTCHAS
jgi:two-component system chemotaxis response regulator CheB